MKKPALALAALLLAGCSVEPVDQTHNGELTDSDPKVEQDNSPYDEYRFDADEGWNITVDMTSDRFDTYLWLIGPDNASLAQNDDITGQQGTNSRITFTAPSKGTYTVRANSLDGSGRGPYQVHIVARPASAQ